MADDVSIQIGANLEDLTSSIESAKNTILGLGAAFGVALSLEGLKSYIESMAELGLQTERTAAILGISNQAVVELSGFAKITGTDIGSLSTGIERMSLQIQRSTRDSVNPQAQALKILGISAKELIGLPADQWFLKLSEAVSRFNPSLNLTNAIMAVGGRGIAQMIPALMKGAEGFKEFQREIQQASEGMAAAVPGMANTHEKLTLLGIAVQSLGARIFTALKPAIDGIVTALTNWVESFHGDTIQNTLNSIAIAAIETGRAIALFAVGLADSIANLVAKLRSTLSFFAGVASVFVDMATSVANLSNLWHGATAKMANDVEGVVTRINTMADAMRTAFVQTSKFSGEMDSDLKRTAGAINEQATQMVAAAEKAIDGQITVLRRGLKEKIQILDEEAATFAITQDKKFALTEMETAKEYAAEAALLQKKLALTAGMPEKQQEVLNQMSAAYAKYTADMAALDRKSIAEQQKEWMAFLSTIESSFNSQLRGLLAGTTTWSQAFKRMLGDMIIKWIEGCETMVVRWVAAQLAITTASVTGAGARKAADAVAATAGVATQEAGAFAVIMADAAKTFAGIFGFLAPVMGPAAAGPAAAGQATVAATAASIGSFAVGTSYVPQTGMALVHQGEAIIPAEANPNNAGSGGGSTTNNAFGGQQVSLSINAMDPSSFASLIMRNRSAFTSTLSALLANKGMAALGGSR